MRKAVEPKVKRRGSSADVLMPGVNDAIAMGATMYVTSDVVASLHGSSNVMVLVSVAAGLAVTRALRRSHASDEHRVGTQVGPSTLEDQTHSGPNA